MFADKQKEVVKQLELIKDGINTLRELTDDAENFEHRWEVDHNLFLMSVVEENLLDQIGLLLKTIGNES
jgi:hypothetical protein